QSRRRDPDPTKRRRQNHHSSPHVDYDGSAFGVLLDLDPAFGSEWIDWMYEQSKPRGWLSNHDDNRDYSDLWLRDDFLKCIRGILERVKDHQKAQFSISSYGEVFMRLRQNHPHEGEIRARQDKLLLNWIAERADDHESMTFVFSLVQNSTP